MFSSSGINGQPHGGAVVLDSVGCASSPPGEQQLERAKATAKEALKSLQALLTPAGINQEMKIDWSLGTAELRDGNGEVRTLLKVPPAHLHDEPDALTQDCRVAEALGYVASAATSFLYCKAREQPADPSCWSLPTTLTLDGDVLRTDRFVLSLFGSDGKRSDRADILELSWLSWQRQTPAPIAQGTMTRRGHGRPAFIGPALPTLDTARPPSQRQRGHWDETWLFHISDDVDVSTNLANSRKEPVRLFCVDPRPGSDARPEKVQEIVPQWINPGWDEVDRQVVAHSAAMALPLPAGPSTDHKDRQDAHEQLASHGRRLRFMVVGDSQRVAGSPIPRAGAYDGRSLAGMLHRATQAIAQKDGAAPASPQRVSIVSSHHESKAFRQDPSDPGSTLGEEFIDEATRLFDSPSMTASLRSDAVRVAFNYPGSEDREGHPVELVISKNSVYVEDPALGGRKFVRTADGRYLNKAPGGVVVLSKRDGTIHRRFKVEDFGQAHVADTTQRPSDGLLKFLTKSDDAPPLSPSVPQSGQKLLLGEVEVDEPLLDRMGAQLPVGHLDEPGAYRRLRFNPAELKRLLTQGTPPERVTALRLLKQIMRSGVQPQQMVLERAPILAQESAKQAQSMIEMLRDVDKGLDDHLLLATNVWQALWVGHGEPPPLPLAVPAKGHPGL